MTASLLFLPLVPFPALTFPHPLLFAPGDEGGKQLEKVLGTKTDFFSLIRIRMKRKMKGFMDFHMSISLRLSVFSS